MKKHANILIFSVAVLFFWGTTAYKYRYIYPQGVVKTPLPAPPLRSEEDIGINLPSDFQNSENDLVFAKLIHNIIVSRSFTEQDGSDVRKLLKKSTFPVKFWGFAVSVYQDGTNGITLIRRGRNPGKTAATVLETITSSGRLDRFNADKEVSIRFCFILNQPEPINWKTLDMTSTDDNRFEVGIDGLRIAYQNRIRYLMPGDGYTKSILSKKHLKQRVSALFNTNDFTSMDFYRFQTQSFLYQKGRLYELYRGYPKRESLTPAEMKEISAGGIENLMRHQTADGAFMYYYDSYRNTEQDHNARSATQPLSEQYNMVRHYTGSMALLHYNEYTGDRTVLDSIRKSLQFGSSKMKNYTLKNGKKASFISHNNNGKLGAAALGLLSHIEYERLSGDKTFSDIISRLYNHITDQLLPDGEFRYFYEVNGKRADDSKNRNRFNFYYSGEALLALTHYYLYQADEEQKKELKELFDRSIDFLLHKRPEIYKKHYKSLPSDAWLMMTFDLMIRNGILDRQDIVDFTFNEADQMMAHQYNESDALYPDYVGAFYYKFGDQPYTDGARSEGLVGALKLALYKGENSRILKIGQSLWDSALCTSRLYNDEASVYFAENSAKALGGIRFKYTRQWYRIDSIQHVVSFYLKFLPIIESEAQIYQLGKYRGDLKT